MSSRISSLYRRLSEGYKWQRFPWKQHVLVGRDLQGNEYWEMPNPLGGRMKRWVQMKEHSDYAVFEQNQLPVQWQAWLRHTRPSAPTPTELMREVERRELIQQRAHQLEAEWTEQRQEQAAIPPQPKASSLPPQPSSKKEPTGQGDTFEPGEWAPTSRRQR